MKPYILNVDRNYPIGEIVGEYGDHQWNKGFAIGLVSGLCIGSTFAWILLSRKR